MNICLPYNIKNFPNYPNFQFLLWDQIENSESRKLKTIFQRLFKFLIFLGFWSDTFSFFFLFFWKEKVSKIFKKRQFFTYLLYIGFLLFTPHFEVFFIRQNYKIIKPCQCCINLDWKWDLSILKCLCSSKRLYLRHKILK